MKKILFIIAWLFINLSQTFAWVLWTWNNTNTKTKVDPTKTNQTEKSMLEWTWFDNYNMSIFYICNS